MRRSGPDARGAFTAHLLHPSQCPPSHHGPSRVRAAHRALSHRDGAHLGWPPRVGGVQIPPFHLGGPRVGSGGRGPRAGVARGCAGKGRRARARESVPQLAAERAAVSAVMSQPGPGPLWPRLQPCGGRDACPSPRATHQPAAGARAPRAANQRGGSGAGRAGPGARSRHAVPPSQPQRSRQSPQLRARGPAPWPVPMSGRRP